MTFGSISLGRAAPLSEHELQQLGAPLMQSLATANCEIWGDNAARCTKRLVPIQGQPFNQAIEVDNGGSSAHPYDVQLLVRMDQSIHRGDAIWTQFYGRKIKGTSETGEVYSEFLFQHVVPPKFSVQYRQNIGFTSDWRRFDIRFIAKEDIPAQKGAVVLRLGYNAGTIQIGGLQVMDFADKVDLKDLPETLLSYEGRESTALWRKEAAARIDKLRKGDLTVTVTDAVGHPIPDAEIHVRMIRRAFPFGNIVNSPLVDGELAQTDDGRHYRDIFLKLFNKGVADRCSWRWWENPDFHRAQMQDIAWFHTSGIESIHATHVIWGKWSRIPTTTGELSGDYKGIRWSGSGQDAAGDKGQASYTEYMAHVQADGADGARQWLRDRARAHVTDVVVALAGKVSSWNVVNELYNEHVLTDIVGLDELAEWFKLAHQADPKAKLFINDYGVIGPHKVHEDAYCGTIQFLLDKGAPLQVIGEQSHFGAPPPDMKTVQRVLDRLGSFGLPVEITEFDVDTSDDQLQADYIRDYLTLCFSHPAVQGITLWGFWQGDHWKPNGGLWRKDWSPRPSALVLEDLLTRQWWTDQTGKTDAAGVYSARGFMGNYDIQVTAAGKSATLRVTLPHEGARVFCKLN